MFSAPQASAQTVAERAGELKTWREQCNDPDPDLRLAYVEAALATGDASIQRICIRIALESGNADIRNLGLRAAIARLDQITFAVEIPAELKAAYDEAGNDRKKLDKIERASWSARNYATIQNGLTFILEDASVTSSSSSWYPLGGVAEKSENYQGKAVITGDAIDWVGNASLGRSWKCRLHVVLAAGGILEGKLQCANHVAFPVSAKLF
jgi:hypothetical protein